MGLGLGAPGLGPLGLFESCDAFGIRLLGEAFNFYARFL